jgi:hypothetical protein
MELLLPSAQLEMAMLHAGGARYAIVRTFRIEEMKYFVKITNARNMAIKKRGE